MFCLSKCLWNKILHKSKRKGDRITRKIKNLIN